MILRVFENQLHDVNRACRIRNGTRAIGILRFAAAGRCVLRGANRGPRVFVGKERLAYLSVSLSRGFLNGWCFAVLSCARWRGSHATVEQVAAYSFSSVEFRGFAVSGRDRTSCGWEHGVEWKGMKRRRPTIHYTTRHNDACDYPSACHALDMTTRISPCCSCWATKANLSNGCRQFGK